VEGTSNVTVLGPWSREGYQ